MPDAPRPPYRLAYLAAAAVFGLYAATLSPTVAFWDAGDYLTTAHILGIPHPPGNPVFVLLAHTWSTLLAWTGLSAAVRINLFSAAMGAGAAGLWFLIAHRILAYVTPLEKQRRIGAALAVVLSTTVFTVWNHSNVNEKVYTVSLFTVALLTWIALRWRDRVEGGGASMRPILLIVFILALSVGNHLMAFLAAPALVLFFLLVGPRYLLNPRLLIAGAAFAILGLSAHLYLPIRSGLDPIINEAAPTCETMTGAVTSVVTFGRAGCENLSAALAREQYAKPPVTERLSPLPSQIVNYAQYFDWQWGRSLDGGRGYFSLARLPLTLTFLFLAFWGAREHRRADGKSFAYLATLLGTFSIGLVFYMNFKYGFGQAAALGLPLSAGEVRERDYFFLVSFALWGVWAGIGLTGLWIRWLEACRLTGHRQLWAHGLLTIAILPLVLNWSYATRTNDWAARDFAYNMLQSVGPYGVLFTNGDNDTLPLWYVQEVEGIRRDVTVVQTAYLNTDWYARQIRDLTRECPTAEAWRADETRIICQRIYEHERAPEFYALRPKPADSILPVTDEEIARTSGSYAVLSEDMLFAASGIRILVPADTFLTPSDQFGLKIIQSSTDRPIHFASIATPARWGLDAHVARHGLTYKLVPPDATAGLTPMPANSPNSWAYGAYLDVERNRRLLWDVFEHRDLLERRVWADAATRNMPTYYVAAHVALAEGEWALGDGAAAERNLVMAARWDQLAGR